MSLSSKEVQLVFTNPNGCNFGGQLIEVSRFGSAAYRHAQELNVILPLKFLLGQLGSNHSCTSSIGMALFRDQSISIDELLRRADTALYQAKPANNHSLRFFDSALQEAVEAWSAVESDLRKAVVEDQFLLHCQVHVNPSCLKRSPLDQLKIDQSFVRDILTGAKDAVIAKRVITLGKSLGLAVIAEGVETEAPMDLLVSSGCHAYQGYRFSHPVEFYGVGPLERSGFDRVAKMLEADVSLETG